MLMLSEENDFPGMGRFPKVLEGSHMQNMQLKTSIIFTYRFW